MADVETEVPEQDTEIEVPFAMVTKTQAKRAVERGGRDSLVLVTALSMHLSIDRIAADGALEIYREMLGIGTSRRWMKGLRGLTEAPEGQMKLLRRAPAGHGWRIPFIAGAYKERNGSSVHAESMALITAASLALALKSGGDSTTAPARNAAAYISLKLHGDNDGVSWPTHETIGEIAGMSRASAANAIADLERVGLVSHERRMRMARRSDGAWQPQRTSNLYMATSIDDYETAEQHGVRWACTRDYQELAKHLGIQLREIGEIILPDAQNAQNGSHAASSVRGELFVAPGESEGERAELDEVNYRKGTREEPHRSAVAEPKVSSKNGSSSSKEEERGQEQKPSSTSSTVAASTVKNGLKDTDRERYEATAFPTEESFRRSAQMASIYAKFADELAARVIDTGELCPSLHANDLEGVPVDPDAAPREALDVLKVYMWELAGSDRFHIQPAQSQAGSIAHATVVALRQGATPHATYEALMARVHFNGTMTPADVVQTALSQRLH